MYHLKIIVSGKVCEVIKSYTKFEGGSRTRAAKAKKTPEQMEEQNYRNAVKKLTRTLNCNFTDGDLWVTLTNRKNQRLTPAEEEKKFSNFISRVRYRFRKAGEEFKWVAVTEYKNKAIHHHLVVNNPDGLNVVKILQSQWKEYGIVHIKPLYSDGQYQALAEYMVKETRETFRERDGGRMQRWSSSRNLKKPKVYYRKVRAATWNPQPRPKKGYRIDTDSVVNGVNAWTGRRYQSYTMIRLE